MAKKEIINPRILKGTRDFLPSEMIQREFVIGIIKEVFEGYGYQPLETPSMEFLDILTGKYGEEGDKLMFRMAYKDGETLALRYDLTVPLSRLIAMHGKEFPMPFKRYQIQPVWRAEKPQKGRLREFFQCDADCIGTKSMLADAEIIAMTHEILNRLGFTDFKIRINHRKILKGLLAKIGIGEAVGAALYRIIDKKDKIGMKAVQSELLNYEENLKLPGKEIGKKILESIGEKGSPEDILKDLEANHPNEKTVEAGIRETRELLDYLNSFSIPESSYELDLAMVRGLDYYTGPIFETVIEEPKVGSITGGGRYDDLIGLYSGTSQPATGTTIGLERIITVMRDLSMLPDQESHTQVLVTVFGTETVGESIKLSRELRQAGLKVEIFLEKGKKIGKQFDYGNKRGIPYLLVLGSDEIEKGTVTIKDMKAGTQKNVPRNEILEHLKL